MRITRRTLIASAGATAAAGVLPQSAWAAPNIVAWHDRTLADHSAQVTANAAKGYRTLSLTLYGERNDPRVAAVMVKRPTIIAEQQICGWAPADFQKFFNEMSAKGMGPYIVCATGPLNDPIFGASFRPMTPTPLTKFGMTAEEFQDLNYQIMLTGGILQWADTYGDANDIRFTAVWHPDPDKAGWCCDNFNDDIATMQSVFNARTEAFSRLGHIAVTPSGGYLAMYTDTTIGPWEARGDLTSAGYQSAVDTATAKGMIPLRVMAKGSGAATRFAAIFTTREEIDKRTPTYTKTTPDVPAIETAMLDFMTKADLRGGALAITCGPRLVYAKGFTNAEASYPAIQPETLFRQASVSKLFCSVALYRLMQEKIDKTPGLTFDKLLDTKLLDILDMTPPPGLPSAGGLEFVTLRNMLESDAGLDNDTMWWSVLATECYGTQLPATSEQIQGLGGFEDLKYKAGDRAESTYSNMAYFLLGQVVKTWAGTATFEAALDKLVLKPMGMKRTRGARSLVKDQLPDEARYHLRVYRETTNPDGTKSPLLYPLTVDWSVKTPDRPRVASQYGGWDYEVFDGAGGLSSSVVDVARLGAIFNSPGFNPVLREDTFNTLLENSAKAGDDIVAAINAKAAAAGKPPSYDGVHGFHGCDGVQRIDPANKIYHGWKGGWIPSHGTTIDFTTKGGYGFAAAFNGDARVDGLDWFGAVFAATVAQGDWAGADLWLQFQMAPLKPAKAMVTSISPIGSKATLSKKGGAAAIKIEQASTLKGEARKTISTPPRARSRQPVRPNAPAGSKFRRVPITPVRPKN